MCLSVCLSSCLSVSLYACLSVFLPFYLPYSLSCPPIFLLFHIFPSFFLEIYSPTPFRVRRQGGLLDLPDPPSRTPLTTFVSSSRRCCGSVRRLGSGRRDSGGEFSLSDRNDSTRGLAVPKDVTTRHRHHEHQEEIIQILNYTFYIISNK